MNDIFAPIRTFRHEILQRLACQPEKRQTTKWEEANKQIQLACLKKDKKQTRVWGLGQNTRRNQEIETEKIATP